MADYDQGEDGHLSPLYPLSWAEEKFPILESLGLGQVTLLLSRTLHGMGGATVCHDIGTMQSSSGKVRSSGIGMCTIRGGENCNDEHLRAQSTRSYSGLLLKVRVRPAGTTGMARALPGSRAHAKVKPSDPHSSA